MKDKLTINDLTTHLGYGLNFLCIDDGESEILPMVGIEVKDGFEIIKISNIEVELDYINNPTHTDKYYPILKPLSDLENGEEAHIDELYQNSAEEVENLLFNEEAPIGVYKFLLERGYDVNHLINRGLGVDVNELTIK